jgi:hypothetical protein
MHDLVKALRIIRKIKTKISVPPSEFPKGFHLFEDPARGDRIAA